MSCDSRFSQIMALNGFAKSLRVLRSSRILNECNLYCKIVKYCILSEVCMIIIAPYGTVSPQMWCTKSLEGWFTRSQTCWQDFVDRKKFGLICFPRICFPGLIYCDQEPLWLWVFLCVHIRLSSRCKIRSTLSLDCLQIIIWAWPK